MQPDSVPTSRKAELVDVIAHDIREGVYHPRERLIEVELCERYGASRGAVRAALIELAALGLVEREANRGARVRRVSIDEAIESTEVRLTLQAMCAGRAATRVTDEDRAELAALLDDLRAAVDDRRPGRATRRRTPRSRASSGASAAIRPRRASSNPCRARCASTGIRTSCPIGAWTRCTSTSVSSAAVIAGDADEALRAAYQHRDNVLDALRGIRDATADEPA